VRREKKTARRNKTRFVRFDDTPYSTHRLGRATTLRAGDAPVLWLDARVTRGRRASCMTTERERVRGEMKKKQQHEKEKKWVPCSLSRALHPTVSFLFPFPARWVCPARLVTQCVSPLK
jgi:hypothetical protein